VTGSRRATVDSLLLLAPLPDGAIDACVARVGGGVAGVAAEGNDMSIDPDFT